MDSDSDELFEDSWSSSKRKKLMLNSSEEFPKRLPADCEKDNLTERSQKFEELKNKSLAIIQGSAVKRHKTEVRRSQKLIKKALKDPFIKAVVEGEESSSKELNNKREEEWESVKPFLFINKHLQGPVSHGDCGPKTELEYQIEDCIKEGDFEKAELLSDTLANRKFTVEIASAFAAKKYKEKQEELKALEEKMQKKKKLRSLFDAKEKWQMKGNM